MVDKIQPAQLQCKLLNGAPALFAQLLLAVLAFSTLVYKRYRLPEFASSKVPADRMPNAGCDATDVDVCRHRERPQRPYKIWIMDVSKQVFSSGAGHICGESCHT
jgi:hypothetical protein